MQQAHEGDSNSMNALINEVYDELKMIAVRQRSYKHGALQTTELVNEAWLRLEKYGLNLKNKRHFLAVAATAMRQILIDEARAALTTKRGGDQIRVTYHTVPGQDFDAVMLLQLDKGLDWLATKSDRMLNVFQMRYFVGFSEAEVASNLGISERTVRRDWIKARALLSSHI